MVRAQGTTSNKLNIICSSLPDIFVQGKNQTFSTTRNSKTFTIPHHIGDPSTEEVCHLALHPDDLQRRKGPVAHLEADEGKVLGSKAGGDWLLGPFLLWRSS